MMNVLDALKPRQSRIVNMMRLVIEDGEFVYIAHNLAQIGVAIGGLSHRLRTEGR